VEVRHGADVRAGTPSLAARLIVPDHATVCADLDRLAHCQVAGQRRVRPDVVGQVLLVSFHHRQHSLRRRVVAQVVGGVGGQLLGQVDVGQLPPSAAALQAGIADDVANVVGQPVEHSLVSGDYADDAHIVSQEPEPLEAEHQLRELVALSMHRGLVIGQTEIAQERGLQFAIRVDAAVPGAIETGRHLDGTASGTALRLHPEKRPVCPRSRPVAGRRVSRRSPAGVFA